MERVKVGNVYIELPDPANTDIRLAPTLKATVAERPETPEPLEEQHYIYRPNDPFGASIDEAHAIASITHEHKPWVRNTWFVIFVIGPLVYAELSAFSMSLTTRGGIQWREFFVANSVVFPIWLIYFSIWWRRVRRPGRLKKQAK